LISLTQPFPLISDWAFRVTRVRLRDIDVREVADWESAARRPWSTPAEVPAWTQTDGDLFARPGCEADDLRRAISRRRSRSTTGKRLPDVHSDDLGT
jgi:hypothetical protein